MKLKNTLKKVSGFPKTRTYLYLLFTVSWSIFLIGIFELVSGHIWTSVKSMLIAFWMWQYAEVKFKVYLAKKYFKMVSKKEKEYKKLIKMLEKMLLEKEDKLIN